MKRLSIFLAFVVLLVGGGVAFEFLASKGVAFQISPGSSIIYLPSGSPPSGNCSSAYLPFNWVIPAGPLYFCNGSPGTWTAFGTPSEPGGMPGAIAVLTSPTAAITSTETTILAAPIPANATKLGTTFRVTTYCLATVTSTGAGSSAMRLRWGPTGTPTDALVLSNISAVAPATNTANTGFSTAQVVTFSASNAVNTTGTYINTGAVGAWPLTQNMGYATSSGGIPVTSPEFISVSFLNTGGFVSVVCNNAMIELLKP